MSLIKDTWRQLVRNRLWPIAIVLVAALAAVPMMLSKDPAPAPPAPAPATPTSASASADRLALDPVVAKADASQMVRRRHVLGDRKDPFKPAPQPKAKVTKVQSSTTTTSPGVAGTGGSSSGGSSSNSGGSSGGGTSAPVTSAPTGVSTPAAPPKKVKHYPADSLTVRFGSADTNPKSVLAPGKPLPERNDAATNPLLVYLGLDKTGKQAIFLLDASVNADGDGKCLSGGAAQCETLRMRAGDTEFLDVTDDTGAAAQQYELDVVAIHTIKGAKSAKARKARASKIEKAWAAKVHTSLAGAARAGGSANIGAGVGALLGSL